MAAMVKKVLPLELRNTFQVGLTLNGRMDSIFLVPNEQVATERMFRQMDETLKLRYENERNFSLDGNV